MPLWRKKKSLFYDLFAWRTFNLFPSLDTWFPSYRTGINSDLFVLKQHTQWIQHAMESSSIKLHILMNAIKLWLKSLSSFQPFNPSQLAAVCLLSLVLITFSQFFWFIRESFRGVEVELFLRETFWGFSL